MIPIGIVTVMHRDLTTSLRGEIRAEMARQRITQDALASSTGKHPQTVGNILNGKSPLTLEYACIVADALAVDLGDLLSRAKGQAA